MLNVCTDPYKNSTIDKCESPTSTAIDYIDIPLNCELNAIFDEDDMSVCTNCTEQSEMSCDTVENARESDSSVCREENIRDMESHLIYQEEKDVTYMVPLPKMGTPRGSSLTSDTQFYNGRGYHRTKEVPRTVEGLI